MERCPVCKARLKPSTPICPRCGADMSTLLSIENKAKSLCYQAIVLLENGDFNGARRAVEQSIELKPEQLAQALRGFIDFVARKPINL